MRGRSLIVGIMKCTETRPLPEDRLDALPFAPQFLPQPANVGIQCACVCLRRTTKDLLQKNCPWYDFATILH
jgi:hypothetical protein